MPTFWICFERWSFQHLSRFLLLSVEWFYHEIKSIIKLKFKYLFTITRFLILLKITNLICNIHCIFFRFNPYGIKLSQLLFQVRTYLNEVFVSSRHFYINNHYSQPLCWHRKCIFKCMWEYNIFYRSVVFSVSSGFLHQ